MEVEELEVLWPAAGPLDTTQLLCPLQVVVGSLYHQLFFFINSLFYFVCLLCGWQHEMCHDSPSGLMSVLCLLFPLPALPVVLQLLPLFSCDWAGHTTAGLFRTYF